MIKTRYPAYLIMTAWLVLTAASGFCQSADGNEVLVVWGESPIYEGNTAQAKERALQDAFSTAISQVMGAFITAESYTQNFVSIDRSVLSKTRGYVRTYETLEVKETRDDLSLKVKATVSRDSIKDDITALGILLDAMGNPVVELQAREEGLDTPESLAVFKQVLGRKGFYLLDRTPGKKADVTVTLTGKITNQSTIGGTGFSGMVVSLEAKAVQAATQKLITTQDMVMNGAGLNTAAALKDAYRKAAEDLAPKLVEGLSEKWGQELTSGRPLHVVVRVDDYRKLQQFTKALEHVFGVKKTDLKSFQNGEAEYLVAFTGQTKTFVDLLLKSGAEKTPISVQGLTADTVRLMVN